MSRNIKDATPELRLLWEQIKDWTDGKRYVIITNVLRLRGVQAAYYAQGRAPLAEVNRLRKLVGLPPLTFLENTRRITNAKPGQSAHERQKDGFVHAFDIGVIDLKTKGYLDEAKYYNAVRSLIKVPLVEIKWDRPHIQIVGSIARIK